MIRQWIENFISLFSEDDIYSGDYILTLLGQICTQITFTEEDPFYSLLEDEDKDDGDNSDWQKLPLDETIRAEFVYSKIERFVFYNKLIENPKKKISGPDFRSFLMEIDEILSMKYYKYYKL